jgi:hypothetical protein
MKGIEEDRYIGLEFEEGRGRRGKINTAPMTAAFVKEATRQTMHCAMQSSTAKAPARAGR